MAALCPICRKAPAVDAFRPFCSRRCADVDLQGWLSGRYSIAAQEEDDPEPEALNRVDPETD